MLRINYQNTSLISQAQIQKTAGTLSSYIQQLQEVAEEVRYDHDESSINLPFDKKLVERVQESAQEKVSENLKYIIDIGIGGSSLGTKAIYDALFGHFDAIEPKRFPKLIFADTNDADFLGRLQHFLKEEIQDPAEVLVNTISKSGTTTETVVNLEVLEEFIPNARNRVVITTGAGSKLAKAAKQQNITCLSIPAKVGGRFSVFSAVGLFPLVAAGINIDALLKGAREMREQCLNENASQNPAVLSAAILYLHSQKGKSIHDNFFFHPELESLGKWYKQLMAESLGKDGKGITPTVSIGSTDLHSMVQLYLDGPKDKFTTFVWGKHQKNPVTAPISTPFAGLVEDVGGKSATEVMQAIYHGVKIAYQKEGLPFVEIVLPGLTEASLGMLLQFKMMEIMFLAQLLRVNAFNQPAVESYKREARRALAGIS